MFAVLAAILAQCFAWLVGFQQTSRAFAITEGGLMALATTATITGLNPIDKRRGWRTLLFIGCGSGLGAAVAELVRFRPMLQMVRFIIPGLVARVWQESADQMTWGEVTNAQTRVGSPAMLERALTTEIKMGDADFAT